MNRRRFVRASLWLLALALFAWVVSRVSFTEAWAVLRELDTVALATLVAVNALALVAYGVRWSILLDGLDHPIGLRASATYRLAAFGFAYFTPGPQIGGEPAQVLLVENRHGVPRDVAIASVALDRLFDGVLNLAFLVAAAFVLVEDGVWVLVFFVAAPLAYLIALGLGKRPLSAIVGKDVVRDSESQAGRFFRDRPLHLAAAIAASFGSWAILLSEYWLLAFFLGVRLSVSEIVIGVAAARIAYLLFFPAGLGVLEAGQVAAIRSLGLPAALGLSLSLVMRVRDVSVASIGLWWGMKLLSGRDRRADSRYSPSTVTTSDDR